MPIPTRCPACGNTAMIFEQYAGQSIPCQTCGQPMQVPATAPASSSLPIWAVILGILAVVLLGCGGVLVALLLPAIQAAREAANRNVSRRNMQQLGLAALTYESATRTFPPAVVRDANGKPLYSGFVLLLPYMEEKMLFDQFKKDEPWDSPHNLPLSQRALQIFQDPSSTETVPYRTDYEFVTGPGTVFEDGKRIRMRDISDGTPNTILFIEVKGNRRSWAEPGGWDASQVSPPVEGHHYGSVIAGFADGHVAFIPNDLPAAGWKAITSRNGGEPNPLPGP